MKFASEALAIENEGFGRNSSKTKKELCDKIIESSPQENSCVSAAFLSLSQNELSVLKLELDEMPDIRYV